MRATDEWCLPVLISPISCLLYLSLSFFQLRKGNVFDGPWYPGWGHHTSSLFCLLGIWKFFSFAETHLEWLLYSSEPSTGYCLNICWIRFHWHRYFCANASEEENKVSTVWALCFPICAILSTNGTWVAGSAWKKLMFSELLILCKFSNQEALSAIIW